MVAAVQFAGRVSKILPVPVEYTWPSTLEVGSEPVHVTISAPLPVTVLAAMGKSPAVVTIVPEVVMHFIFSTEPITSFGGNPAVVPMVAGL